MRVALTGHTRGVGKAIADEVRKRGWDLVGFSRSNEYDIVNPIPIIEAARDCDIFVNNAHFGYAQVVLLWSMAKTWADQPDKLIVSMGSLAADGIKPGRGLYAIYKKALDGLTEQLQSDPTIRCRISILRFGYVDTDMVAHVDAPKLGPSEVARQLFHIIDQPQGMYVKRIDFRIHHER